MTTASTAPIFIGWDVGGWNCDKNPVSRDALAGRAALHHSAACSLGDRTRRKPRALRASCLGSLVHRCNHPALLAANARPASSRSSNGTTLSLKTW